jgi:hypothetical protein
MKYTLIPDDMYFFLNGVHVSLFGRSSINDSSREKKREKFIKRNSSLGLTDARGNPNPELAKVLAPVIINRCEVARPYPFVNVGDIRLRSTFFISEEGVTFAKKVGRLRTEFELELLEDKQAITNRFIDEFGLDAMKFADHPFELQVPAEEGFKIAESLRGGNPEMVRRFAHEHDVSPGDLLNIISAIVSNNDEPFAEVLIAREPANGGTILLHIDQNTGSAIRNISMPPEREAESLYSFELITEQNLWDYALDFKGR